MSLGGPGQPAKPVALLRRFKAAMIIIAAVGSNGKLRAQTATAVTATRQADTGLEVGTMARVTCCSSREWHVGRVSAITPDSLMLASAKESVRLARATLGQVEKRKGHDVATIVHWAIVGATIGFVAGSYAHGRMFGTQDLGNMGTQFGGAIGLASGAVISATLSYAVASDEWVPTTVPWPLR